MQRKAQEDAAKIACLEAELAERRQHDTQEREE